MQKVLAFTVGTGRQGEPAEPILFSLECSSPGYVVFFVSRESERVTLSRILERGVLEKGTFEVCRCEDENDIIGCYVLFRDSLKRLVTDGVTEFQRIAIDYTTGTKAMSAALVMAGISLGVNSLNYISGTRENGTVVNGTEKLNAMRPSEIYWDALHRQVIENFNACRFPECLNLIGKMLPITAERDKRARADFLRGLAESYLVWDLFDIGKALNGLAGLKEKELLKEYGCKVQVEQNIGFLSREVEKGEYSVEKAGDLYENARRRFEEGKYDDCVARLYRLLEYMSQVSLFERHKIKTARMPLSEIPEHCRDLFSKKGDVVDIALMDGYKLLARLDDPIGKRFEEMKEEIKKVLQARNFSILAHGFTPLGKEKAERVFALVEPLITEFAGNGKALKGSKFSKLVWK